MITLKIDVKKIDKDLLFKGEKGTYLDLALFDRPDEYENDGYIVQSVTKEKREAGERGPIVGNWRNRETSQKPASSKPKTANPADDDLPF